MNELIAVEPECCAATQLITLASVVGFHEGRFIAEYPRYWVKLAYKATNCVSDDMQRSLLNEAIAHIKETSLLSTQRIYDQNQTWRNNAFEGEKAGVFGKVLTDGDYPMSENIHRIFPKKWSSERGIVQRAPTVDFFLFLLNPLLISSGSLVLIDPYFKPLDAKTLPLFKAVLRVAFQARCKEFVAFVREKKWGWNQRQSYKLLIDKIGTSISPGKNVTIHVCDDRYPTDWEEEGMHTRFIFSEKGGINLDKGLQLRGKDFSYIDKTQHEELLREYVEGLPPFKIHYSLRL